MARKPRVSRSHHPDLAVRVLDDYCGLRRRLFRLALDAEAGTPLSAIAEQVRELVDELDDAARPGRLAA